MARGHCQGNGGPVYSQHSSYTSGHQPCCTTASGRHRYAYTHACASNGFSAALPLLHPGYFANVLSALGHVPSDQLSQLETLFRADKERYLCVCPGAVCALVLCMPWCDGLGRLLWCVPWWTIVVCAFFGMSFNVPVALKSSRRTPLSSCTLMSSNRGGGSENEKSNSAVHDSDTKYTQWLLGSTMFKLLSMFDFLQSVCTTLVLALNLCILLFLVPGESGSGWSKCDPSPKQKKK